MSKQQKEKQDLDAVPENATPMQEIPTATPTDSEGLPIIKPKRNFRTVVTGAEFKEFEIGEVFEGAFVEKVIREKDGPEADKNPNQKAGTVMGYLFKPDKGFPEIIGASHSVNEVMERVKKGDYVRFTFLGKGQNAKNQPFNRFQIEVAD